VDVTKEQVDGILRLEARDRKPAIELMSKPNYPLKKVWGQMELSPFQIQTLSTPRNPLAA